MFLSRAIIHGESLINVRSSSIILTKHRKKHKNNVRSPFKMIPVLSLNFSMTIAIEIGGFPVNEIVQFTFNLIKYVKHGKVLIIRWVQQMLSR